MMWTGGGYEMCQIVIATSEMYYFIPTTGGNSGLKLQ